MKTPVLFIIFNRPETTARSFATIRAAKPQRLYIAADGPRESRPQEKDLCDQARKIATDVNWPCIVETLYSDSNLGCKKAVVTAIDWFFKNEEAGIIMEDDICAKPEFFEYSEILLEKYKNTPEVGMIAGTCFTEKDVCRTTSYYLSEYSHIWGWASWRRAWAHYSADMLGWEMWFEANKRNPANKQRRHRIEYWGTTFSEAASGKIDTWDYQWQYTMTRHQMLCAVPNVNLIDNIGFGPEATHTKSDKPEFLAGFSSGTLNFPLRHPVSMTANTTADRYIDTAILALDPISHFKRRARNLWKKLREGVLWFSRARPKGLPSTPRG